MTRSAFGALIVIALALVLLGGTPLAAQTCTKECCSQHFTVIHAFLEQLTQLQQRVKTESLADYSRQYHRQTAISYLDLEAGALRDAATHFQQLNDSANQGAVTAMATQLEGARKQLTSAKDDATAKREFATLNLALALPKATAPTSAPASPAPAPTPTPAPPPAPASTHS